MKKHAGKLFKFVTPLLAYAVRYLSHQLSLEILIPKNSVVFVVKDQVPLADGARYLIMDDVTPVSWFVKFMFQEKYFYIRTETWDDLLQSKTIVEATAENSS